jgi:integrase
VRYTIERLEDLLQGEGWEAEFPRDIWLLRRLGYPPGSGPARLRFDRIGQPWLRELAKRWARWRLSTGLSSHHVERDVSALIRLSTFLAACGPGLHAAAGLDRPVLERYLAWLAIERPAPKGRATELGAVAAFLRGVHQHRWAPELPATAAIYSEDRPRRPVDAPRTISEHVMAQLESPANLAQFTQPGYRLLTEILMRTGLRISDACRLAYDCVVRDPDGAAYLRYRNHKMRREALVPIDESLAEAIANQQDTVGDRWPTATCLFPRPTTNPDGTRPVGRGTYVNHLDAWLESCEVIDELGRPVHVTPHQWRHTYATRLDMRGVASDATHRRMYNPHRRPRNAILASSPSVLSEHSARRSAWSGAGSAPRDATDATSRRPDPCHWLHHRCTNVTLERPALHPTRRQARCPAWAPPAPVEHLTSRRLEAQLERPCGSPVGSP